MLYSCIQERKRDYEHYTPEHSMGYIISGEVQFFTASGVSRHGAGSMGLVKRDTLCKTVKIPPAGGEFRSISLHFSSEMLREYAETHGIRGVGRYEGSGMHALDGNAFIKGFFDSLLPYFEAGQGFSDTMLKLKTHEALELLLKHDVGLQSLLFDLSEPYKVDLADYMDRHFMFNVPLDRLARLTGRSLAGFKRDFGQLFGMAPGK